MSKYLSEKVIHNLEKIQIAYENDPTVKAIIKFSRLGEFFMPYISDRVNQIREERTKTFFDELLEGKVKLSEDVIKSEDFLHKFYITYKSAINTRRRKKIEFFARLLLSSLENNEHQDIDIFEDYVKILQDLSFREIEALVLLDSFYQNNRQKSPQNDLIWTKSFWDDFEKELQIRIKISGDSIGSFMSRLSRSGCYELFIGQFFDVDASKGMGRLTSTFHSLKIYALEELGN